MDYFPTHLWRYLNSGIPFPYEELEYQALFGYLRVLKTPGLIRETRLIPSPGRHLNTQIPPAIPTLPAGFLHDGAAGERDLYLSGLHGEFYHSPTSTSLVPQFLACLVSYSDVSWAQASNVLLEVSHDGGILAAARAAASLGNLRLTRKLVKALAIYQANPAAHVLVSVAAASIDGGFARRLLEGFPSLSRHCGVDALRDLIRSDRVDVFRELIRRDKSIFIEAFHLVRRMRDRGRIGAVGEYIERL